MFETYRSRNGRREATIAKGGAFQCGYHLTLTERTRYRSRVRDRYVKRKADAVKIVKEWIA